MAILQGTKNPADSSSRQSAKGALVRKDPVHNVNEAYVRQLMVSEDVTEEETEEALTRILTQHTLDLEILRMYMTNEPQISDQF